MKRLSLIVILGMSISLLPAVISASDNFPNPGPTPPQGHSSSAVQQQRLHYGYIPPAPIRHTWPGGYKVIFHELGNTLSEHILGRY
jgi:hypothetical protein